MTSILVAATLSFPFASFFLGLIPDLTSYFQTQRPQWETVLGVMVQETNHLNKRYPRVTVVIENYPAEKAGIQKDDTILQFNEQVVTDPNHLHGLVRDTAPNTRVKLKISRPGNPRTFVLDVQLGAEKTTVLDLFRKAADIEAKLGFTTTQLTRESAKALGYEGEAGEIIDKIIENSRAYQKGLRVNDLIKTINGRQIRSTNDFMKALQSIKPGAVVVFVLKRDGMEFRKEVVPNPSIRLRVVFI